MTRALAVAAGVTLAAALGLRWGWSAFVAGLLALAHLAVVRHLARQRGTRGEESADAERGRTPRSPAISVRLSGRPTSLVTFAGRRHELQELLGRFEALRAPDAADGAIILAVHGMPGVGKSVLAHELARQLSVHFPDGALFANLGNAGSIRAEADVLNRFLMALGVPKDEIPGPTLERAALFRSATAGKEILVVLDAARDHQQVTRLLPAARGCAVIVTSRRDLAPALGIKPYRLVLPEVEGALEMLLAMISPEPAGTGDTGYDYESAVEIVNTLGRLPLAISAVGDLVAQRAEPLAGVARRLRDRAALEALLSNNGRGVEERIDTEYDRLSGDEQLAFRLLSLVDSASFVPWVLVPLVGDEQRLNHLEAEKLIGRLAERQLLEPAGRDDVTGLDRYRFHPVVRIFAEHRRGEDESLTGPALGRLDDAYLEAVDLILAAGDDLYRRESGPRLPRRWFPAGSSLPRDIGALPQGWVRAESRNLIRCVSAAHRREHWSLCWRVAARLGECVPEGAPADDLTRTFALGLDAAAQLRHRSAARRAQAEVLLARADHLARRESYSPAYDDFHRAALTANHLRPLAAVRRRPRSDPHERAAPGIECDTHRRLAAAHLRAGMYREAAFELTRAERLVPAGGEPRLRRLIALMRAHIEPGSLTGDGYAGADDELYLWFESAMAESERHGGAYKRASDRLRRLRHRYADDVALSCDLLARMADLRLDEHRYGAPVDAGHTLRRALRRAAEALHGYERLGNRVGVVRARCLLVRALVRLHRPKDAEKQLALALSGFARLDPVVSHPLSTVYAALSWARGDLLTEQGLRGEGDLDLRAAAALLLAHGDERTSRMVLGTAAPPPVPGAAGREPAVRLHGEPAAGRVLDVTYSVGPPGLDPDRYPVGARYVRVVLVAPGADVNPPERTARLDAWAPLAPLSFAVTPAAPGRLVLGFLVYDADDGTLLHHVEARPREVTGPALEDAPS
ncbi:NB-ARC domain-containing protein [Pseudosporangium ferrugineum]|uniref:NB-ARC domain-containing protein n=1 Tax=Pseudosporangium ferrugineum TaxID=439699 RepID=A0A2T0RWZ6_9ACTN|nr:NB-ARC domain-containing protein [Pseudosporangium ferrugineum]PRY25715.1 NB-ARC domain-containing protein [Pseudosporangium ferrugineum]